MTMRRVVTLPGDLLVGDGPDGRHLEAVPVWCTHARLINCWDRQTLGVSYVYEISWGRGSDSVLRTHRLFGASDGGVCKSTF